MQNRQAARWCVAGHYCTTHRTLALLLMSDRVVICYDHRDMLQEADSRMQIKGTCKAVHAAWGLMISACMHALPVGCEDHPNHQTCLAAPPCLHSTRRHAQGVMACPDRLSSTGRISQSTWVLILYLGTHTLAQGSAQRQNGAHSWKAMWVSGPWIAPLVLPCLNAFPHSEVRLMSGMPAGMHATIAPHARPPLAWPEPLP